MEHVLIFTCLYFILLPHAFLCFLKLTLSYYDSSIPGRTHTAKFLSHVVSLLCQDTNLKITGLFPSSHGLESFQWMAKQETEN